MHINLYVKTGQRSLCLSCTGLEWFELVLCHPEGNGTRYHYEGVSLKPLEAIAAAHKMLHPPGNRHVPVGNGKEFSIRKLWYVYSLRHSNHCHDGSLGVAKGEIAILNSSFSHEPEGLAEDLFTYDSAISLTDAKIKKIAGVMLHWAGAALIGMTTKVETTETEYLHLWDK